MRRYALGIMLTFTVHAHASEYINEEYGFGVIVPDEFIVCTNPPPHRDNGFAAYPAGTNCDASLDQSPFGVSADYAMLYEIYNDSDLLERFCPEGKKSSAGPKFQGKPFYYCGEEKVQGSRHRKYFFLFKSRGYNDGENVMLHVFTHAHSNKEGDLDLRHVVSELSIYPISVGTNK